MSGARTHRRLLLAMGAALTLPACQGEDDAAPASPEGVWLLDAPGSDGVFGETVDCTDDPAVEATLSIEAERVTFTVQTEDCRLGPHEGDVAEGEDGFVANLVNRYEEHSTLTCVGDGRNAYLCTHTWLDGELRMTRL
ncbi:MAG: hypothetical protein ACRBN8_34250 [Nannocystales bacterium]